MWADHSYGWRYRKGIPWSPSFGKLRYEAHKQGRLSAQKSLSLTLCTLECHPALAWGCPVAAVAMVESRVIRELIKGCCVLSLPHCLLEQEILGRAWGSRLLSCMRCGSRRHTMLAGVPPHLRVLGRSLVSSLLCWP